MSTDVRFAATRPHWILPAHVLADVVREMTRHEAIAADESLPWATRQNAEAHAAGLRRRLRQDADGREMIAQRASERCASPVVQARQQAVEYMPTRPYWHQPAGQSVAAFAANATSGTDDFASRWAALFEAAQAGERAFLG